MSSERSRYAVGVIHHGAYSELPDCVGAVGAQTVPPRWVRILDADASPERLELLLGPPASH